MRHLLRDGTRCVPERKENHAHPFGDRSEPCIYCCARWQMVKPVEVEQEQGGHVSKELLEALNLASDEGLTLMQALSREKSE